MVVELGQVLVGIVEHTVMVGIDAAVGADIRWSMDFASNQLSNGRRFRVLNVKDDFFKELVGQLVAFSIMGAMVGRFLNQLIKSRSAPDQITCDNTTITSKRATVLTAGYPYLKSNNGAGAWRKIPWINLRGFWLEQVGFHIGTLYTIQTYDGKLVFVTEK